MTPILFLDCDGVLNRCNSSGHGLESDKLDLLKEIIDATGARIVVSSTWRLYPHMLKRLSLALVERGMEIYSTTPDLTTPAERHGLHRAVPRFAEISYWLTDNHEDPARCVILDDEKDMGPLAERHVRTGSFTGLTPFLARTAILLLNP